MVTMTAITIMTMTTVITTTAMPPPTPARTSISPTWSGNGRLMATPASNS
jgi:hypothetical protein